MTFSCHDARRAVRANTKGSAEQCGWQRCQSARARCRRRSLIGRSRLSYTRVRRTEVAKYHRGPEGGECNRAVIWYSRSHVTCGEEILLGTRNNQVVSDAFGHVFLSRWSEFNHLRMFPFIEKRLQRLKFVRQYGGAHKHKEQEVCRLRLKTSLCVLEPCPMRPTLN